MDIIPQSTDVPDLGIIMSKDCSFDSHIYSLSRKCNNLAGWILRSIVSCDRLTMLTLFKSLVISRLDYASQLWSPHKISQITQIIGSAVVHKTHYLLTSGCLAVVYSAWSAIAALHLSVIVFSLVLELRLLHSFGTIGESSIEHR